MGKFVSDVAFSPAVKAVQSELGSREFYAGIDWDDRITPKVAAFIAERNSFFLATASAEGQPYIQHRGGPKGFLRLLDDRTLAFADYVGNRQYITTGNLSENERAQIFLMDYQTGTRVKIWGRARIIRDPDFIAMLMPEGYRARPQHAVIFTVAAFDTNCSQHIPKKFDAPDVRAALQVQLARIAELEAEIASLKAEKEKS